MFNVLRLTSLLATLVFAFGAAAADGDMFDSEYFHQAAAGTSELTPGLGGAPGSMVLFNGLDNGLAFGTVNIKDSSLKVDLNVIPINVQYEYGINSMFSVGAILGYGTGTTSIDNCPAFATCKSHTITGLFDPNLYFKGRMAAGAGTFNYGVVARLGVENNKTDSSGDSNFATGGTTLTPFVAYQMPAGAGAWGARFQYDLYKGDRKSTDSSGGSSQDSTKSGGATWTLDTFYEAPVGITTLGGAIFYTQEAESKSATNGGSATGNGDQGHGIGLMFYSPVHFSGVTLLPNVAYESLTYTSSQTLSPSSATLIQIGVAARMTF